MQFKYSYTFILFRLILSLVTVGSLFLVHYSKEDKLFYMISFLIVLLMLPFSLYKYLKGFYVKITDKELIIVRGILPHKIVKLDSIGEIFTNNKIILFVIDKGNVKIFESFMKKDDLGKFYKLIKEKTKHKIKYNKYLRSLENI